MEVGELAKLHNKRNELRKRRDHMIANQFKKKRQAKVNLDQSSVKKGYIQKHKYIQKKKFQTIVEKARKIAVQLQQNVNVNTFLTHSSNYQKILTRTQQRIKFDEAILKQGLSAINSFGITHKQKAINVTLEFQKQVVCEPRPFLIDIPKPQTLYQIVIVLPQIKQKDEEYQFQKIKTLNLLVMTSNQFRLKYNNDKMFMKKIFQQDIKVLVKFQHFKNKKFYQGLLKKGIPIFPIDSKKIPFTLAETVSSYQEYIQYLSQKYLAVTKSGQQQIFRLKAGQVDKLAVNAKAITHELCAKLIERSKVKQNRLLRITIKTASSITLQIYKAPEQSQIQKQ